MLRRRYGSICIPLEQVRREYLGHIGTKSYLLRVIREGRLPLRVVKAEWGGTVQRVVYLHDLADWIDRNAPSNRDNEPSKIDDHSSE
ncbi:Pyocin activator protein PrtN [compost metagenome]